MLLSIRRLTIVMERLGENRMNETAKKCRKGISKIKHPSRSIE